jgi:hypothetical protein
MVKLNVIALRRAIYEDQVCLPVADYAAHSRYRDDRLADYHAQFRIAQPRPSGPRLVSALLLTEENPYPKFVRILFGIFESRIMLRSRKQSSHSLARELLC